jgi:hypothetical protein
MKSPHKGIHVIYMVLALFLLEGSAPASSFDRYGVILDRKPFGTEPVVVPPATPPLPPEKSVVNQIRMSAVVRDSAGVLRVGLVDLKNKRNYMVGIGESVDDIEIIEADYVAERARLRRGPEDYWVSMLGGSNRFERIAEPDPPPPAPDLTAVPAAPPTAAEQNLSYAKRRQQREAARLRTELERLREAEAAKAKAAALASPAAPREAPADTIGSIRAGKKRAGGRDTEAALSATFSDANRLDLSEEEIAQMLQDYQKELLRSGQTPLPIPLTPETDRQLVAEGVLLPQE